MSNGAKIVGFIDNYFKGGLINKLPVVNEKDIGELQFDLIVVTVESNARYLVQERLKEKYSNVILWDDLFII